MPLSHLVWYLQPIFASDGVTVAAYEALVRRPQPDGTVQGPLELLPWLLKPRHRDGFTRASLQAAAGMAAADPTAPPIHVNLAPTQLLSVAAERTLRDLHDDLRARIVIEVTEQAIPQGGAYAEALARIAACGVPVWLDDVQGPDLAERWPSGLAPQVVTGVKFDRSATAEALLDPHGAAATSIAAAAARGVYVVAEGIEERASLPKLRELAALRFQGFGLGVPVADLATARTMFEGLHPARRRDDAGARRANDRNEGASAP